jgi:hypothetical protein
MNFAQLAYKVKENQKSLLPVDVIKPLQGFQFLPQEEEAKVENPQPIRLQPMRAEKDPRDDFPLIVGDLAFQQLCERTKIPPSYIKSLPPKLQFLCVNNGIQERLPTNNNYMLRTVNENTIRAILSERYEVFDNHMLIDALWECGIDPEDEVVFHCDGERITYFKLVWKNQEPVEMAVGDVVKQGIAIRNSEVGCSSVAIEGLVWRLSCLNGAIAPGTTGYRFYHTGDQNRLKGAIKDAVLDAKHQTQALITNFKSALGVALDKSTEFLQAAVGEKTTKEEFKSILDNYLNDGNYSLYGASQAVTRHAQDRPEDRRYDLEKLGGEMVSYNSYTKLAQAYTH